MIRRISSKGGQVQSFPFISVKKASLALFTKTVNNSRAAAEPRKVLLCPLKKLKQTNGDFSINRYKEIVYEDVEYDEPKVILEQIEKLNKEREKLFIQLTKIKLI